MYSSTTNPAVATGDGLAMAYRSGAILANMEFVQFHPTAIAHEQGNTFLITEALRGHGAILVNDEGEPFVERQLHGGSLATRDRVARAIVDSRRRTPFQRTAGLAEVVSRALGGREGRLHPATRVFQALRRAVNEEGEELKRLPCSSLHAFHTPCIRQWLTKQSSCPLCRCECGERQLPSPPPEEDALRLRLAAGASPNDPAGFTKGWAPLIAAAQGGHVNVVRVLVEAGASLEATNNGGFTALMLATSLLGNASVDYKLPFPLYLIIKSSNLVANLLVGSLLFRRTYARAQWLAVFAMTGGVVIATLVSRVPDALPDDPGTPASMAVGAALCAASTLCMSVLGCLQEIFADRGGPRLDHDYCHVIRRSADQPSGTVRGELHGARPAR